MSSCQCERRFWPNTEGRNYYRRKRFLDADAIREKVGEVEAPPPEIAKSEVQTL